MIKLSVLKTLKYEFVIMIEWWRWTSDKSLIRRCLSISFSLLLCGRLDTNKETIQDYPFRTLKLIIVDDYNSLRKYLKNKKPVIPKHQWSLRGEFLSFVTFYEEPFLQRQHLQMMWWTMTYSLNISGHY